MCTYTNGWYTATVGDTEWLYDYMYTVSHKVVRKYDAPYGA